MLNDGGGRTSQGCNLIPPSLSSTPANLRSALRAELREQTDRTSHGVPGLLCDFRQALSLSDQASVSTSLKWTGWTERGRLWSRGKRE